MTPMPHFGEENKLYIFTFIFKKPTLSKRVGKVQRKKGQGGKKLPYITYIALEKKTVCNKRSTTWYK